MSELRAASPSVARLTDLAVWREREAFEEKNNRALVLLRKKDAKIRELGEVVAKRNNSARQRAALGKSTAAAGVGDCDAGGGGANSKMKNNTSATAGVVEMLEERVEEQADQIEALLQEVNASGYRAECAALLLLPDLWRGYSDLRREIIISTFKCCWCDGST